MGKPDSSYKDEAENVVLIYNSRKLRLTFYKDEDFRLGYMTTSNPMMKLFNTSLIGKNWSEVYPISEKNKVKYFESDTTEGILSYFNEEYWLFFHLDYNEIVKIETWCSFQRKRR
ncbi:hypothetical protein [Flavobacterium sp.]|uniref:hypothetical protein n=1 Tax=Flavobacterium sp. TaxID=239 RepID=UPI0040483004